MTKTVLLTSFAIWKPHHTTNASDDLIHELTERKLLDQHIHVLRQLPVDFKLAPEKVIAEIERLQPNLVICCGMAERRSRLSVESNGKRDEDVIYTSINVREIVRGLSITRVSHHAGRFVCNHLYYSLLNYFEIKQLNSSCLFVHVPPLNSDNTEAIVNDFVVLLNRLTQS